MEKILQYVDSGFKEQNPILIAKAATISAKIQQDVRKNKYFEPLAKLIGHEVLGINCAHSGVILGVIFEPHNLFKVTQLVKQIVPEESILGTYNIVNGKL